MGPVGTASCCALRGPDGVLSPLRWNSTHLHRCMENAGWSSRRSVPFLSNQYYVRSIYLYTCIHTIGLLQLKNANSTFLMTNRCPEWNASTNSPFPPFPKLATSRLIKSRTVLLKAPLVNQDTVCGQSTNGSLIIQDKHTLIHTYTHGSHA